MNDDGKVCRCSSLMMPGFVDCHTHVVSYLLAGLRSKFDSVQSGVGNGLNERRIRTLNVIANDKSAANLFTNYVVHHSVRLSTLYDLHNGRRLCGVDGVTSVFSAEKYISCAHGIFAARCYASAAYVVMRCLSVRLSVTFVDHVKTNKHIKIFHHRVGTPF